MKVKYVKQELFHVVRVYMVVARNFWYCEDYEGENRELAIF